MFNAPVFTAEAIAYLTSVDFITAQEVQLHV